MRQTRRARPGSEAQDEPRRHVDDLSDPGILGQSEQPRDTKGKSLYAWLSIQENPQIPNASMANLFFLFIIPV